jgi:probable rRNA maturation factor
MIPAMATLSASPALVPDIRIDAAAWDAQPDSEAVVRRALAAAAAMLEDSAGEVAVLLTDDAAIRRLNRDFRGFDKPTNVLSFPAPDGPGPDGAPETLGDIAIAFETTAAEAQQEGKPFADHLGHLAIHGLLHLFGYDHETDAEAEEMEALEREILASLGVPDPYAEENQP